MDSMEPRAEIFGKPKCNSHQGFRHSSEATGNLGWQRCSRANSECLGWEEIQTDSTFFFFFFSSLISVRTPGS